MVRRDELENGHQYLIEEQVQFIEGKKVEQVDVQVLIAYLEPTNIWCSSNVP
jgi:hypothetical protein